MVSKAEGRTRDLDDVRPGERARELAAQLGKDPRMVELVLAEARRVVRAEAGVLIVETNAGWICANAGIDASNVPGEQTVYPAAGSTPTPRPASSAPSSPRLREDRPGVVIADSFGRPWRLGPGRGRDRLRRDRSRSTTGAGAATSTAASSRPRRSPSPTSSPRRPTSARDKTSGEPAVLVRGAERWWTEEDGPGAGVLRRPRRARTSSARRGLERVRSA